MSLPSMELIAWPDLAADEQEQVLALRISAEQIEFAGTMARAVDKVVAGHGEDLAGLAIRHRGAIVGFVVLSRRTKAPAWADRDAATISAMRIDEQHQGRGLGSAALRTLVGWVRHHWPDAPLLSLSVDEGNAAGLRAYQKAGFVDHGQRVAGRIGWVRHMSLAVGDAAAAGASPLHRVFVFGTLKQGFPNFATNRGVRLAGVFTTVQRLPFYLVGERHSPWLIDQPGAGERVAGQVFEVDDATLAAMDRLERIDEPDGYRRVLIDVAGPGGAAAMPVFAYLKPAWQLAAAQVRAGPLAEYTLDHAALYRPRA